MAFVGGCQCRAVRYRAEAPRDRSSVCFCRMCQRAAGAPFMAFVRFAAAQVRWSRAPATFASSEEVERGFCASCGTPLSWRQVAGPYVSLTIHSLDDPWLVVPEVCFSEGTRAGWCLRLGALPETGM